MIKKILLILSFILLTFFSFDISFSAGCSYNGGDVSAGINSCLSDTDLVQTAGELKVETGFKDQITKWNQKIATYLALGAIFAIVFGSFKMVLSAGEEEKIKKAKDIIKWGIIGLVGVVSAGFIVSVVVKLVYSIGSV